MCPSQGAYQQPRRGSRLALLRWCSNNSLFRIPYSGPSRITEMLVFCHTKSSCHLISPTLLHSGQWVVAIQPFSPSSGMVAEVMGGRICIRVTRLMLVLYVILFCAHIFATLLIAGDRAAASQSSCLPQDMLPTQWLFSVDSHQFFHRSAKFFHWSGRLIGFSWHWFSRFFGPVRYWIYFP
jgi:hypothetical protein